jgi:ubiquitin-conjugating enzyme E2 G1
MPPTMTFISEIWHPNVHSNGLVCISILHAPGEDKYGYEDASERWLPIHTVESIVISVISMLADPNDESPANIEAAVFLLLTRYNGESKTRSLIKRSGVWLGLRWESKSLKQYNKTSITIFNFVFKTSITIFNFVLYAY